VEKVCRLFHKKGPSTEVTEWFEETFGPKIAESGGLVAGFPPSGTIEEVAGFSLAIAPDGDWVMAVAAVIWK
jgi:hypothetical protein